MLHETCLTTKLCRLFLAFSNILRWILQTWLIWYRYWYRWTETDEFSNIFICVILMRAWTSFEKWLTQQDIPHTDPHPPPPSIPSFFKENLNKMFRFVNEEVSRSRVIGVLCCSFLFPDAHSEVKCFDFTFIIPQPWLTCRKTLYLSFSLLECLLLNHRRRINSSRNWNKDAINWLFSNLWCCTCIEN